MRMVTTLLAAALLVSPCPFGAYAQTPPDATGTQTRATGRRSISTSRPVPRHTVPHPGDEQHQAAPELPDSIGISEPILGPAEVVEDEITDRDGRLEVEPLDTIAVNTNEAVVRPQKEWADSMNAVLAADSTTLTAGEAMRADSIAAALAAAREQADEWVPREVEFAPDPTKAVWMSALFPGLGQVYNRRYWKLPIIVGGYLGLAYATNWNSNMLRDYTRAYADLLDNDPNTRSYMDMFSPNVKEENLDRGWLQEVLRSRKNYFRRNRDLCIICMVGVYLLAMVDAYVDASLSHFDISPDLSMDVAPALIQDGRQRYPSVGLMWAVNF